MPQIEKWVYSFDLSGSYNTAFNSTFHPVQLSHAVVFYEHLVPYVSKLFVNNNNLLCAEFT